MKIFGRYNYSEMQDPVSPLLNDVGNSNPFSVPDGYFDDLTNSILKRIKENPVVVSEKSSYFLKTSTIITVVSSIVLLSVSAYFLSPAKQNAIAITPATYNHPLIVIDQNTTNDLIVINPSAEINEVEIIFSGAATEVEIESAINKLPLPAFVEKRLFDYYKNQKQIAALQNQNKKTLALIQPYKLPKSTIFPLINSKLGSRLSGHSETNIDPKLDLLNSMVVITPEGTMIVDLGEAKNGMFPEEICSESRVMLDASREGDFDYRWSTGEVRPDIAVNKSGVYSVTATNKRNPNNIFNGSIKVNILPIPKRNHDFVFTGCVGEPVELTVGQNNSGFEYFWPDLNQFSSTVMVNETGLYIAQIKGCEVYTDSFFVNFQHCEVTTTPILTPNGDGSNDIFIINNLSRFPNTSLTVYNRRGGIVYESKDYQNDWTGSNLADGLFFYVLQFSDGIRQEGTFTVKR